MRTSHRFLFIVLICLVIGASRWSSAPAQENERSFDETGHKVTGEFYSFYHSVANPELVFGYPITEAFLDGTSGLLVQYFQRARFELHPAATNEQRVRLTPIGTYLYEPGLAELDTAGSAGCREFPGTRFQVCYTFLEFFDAHGGLEQFGAPISNMEVTGGLTVQYFERARMEWRPGLDGSSRVRLTDLGSIYFSDQKENLALLLPPSNANIVGVKQLRARAFPAKAVTQRNGVQTIYVLIQDQRAMPVEQVDVRLVLRLPSGEERSVIAPTATDANGITRIPLTFESGWVGMAQVEVIATRSDMKVHTSTSFRIWW